jgi:glycosyltransferase involved in cell wall biosynthesis
MVTFFLQRIAARLPASSPYQRRLQRWGDGRNTAIHVRALQPDVVNVHNIHAAMSVNFLWRLPAHVPMIWTLHDMWALTGGCVYSMDCQDFETGCRGHCRFATTRYADAPAPERVWRTLDRFYRRNASRLALVTPSRWLAGLAERRVKGRIPVQCIPNSLDLGVFKPIADRRAIRLALGLPEDAFIVLTGSADLSDPRKGWRFVREAFERYKATNRAAVLVSFGERPAEATQGIHTGFIRDDALLALHYNAADVFLSASLADNLPNTLVEAAACGVPSIGFDVGGCREVICQGVNGWVVEPGNSDALAAALRHLSAMSSEAVALMRGRCREVALENYDPLRQAGSYRELFSRMVASAKQRNGG